MFELLESRFLLSGVTLITHGEGGSAGGDIAKAANLIAKRAGGASQYVMTLAHSAGNVTVKSFVRDPGSLDPNTSFSGEIIIKLDWSAVSGDKTDKIAAPVAQYLLTQKPTGHSIVEQEIALVGPSRGASVINNLAADLGSAGVWVDQLTFLDPVTLPSYDPEIRIPLNVIFADDYFRSDSLLNTVPDGKRIEGAYNTDLPVIDRFHDPQLNAHNSVAAYYFATIDPTAPIVAPVRAEWYGHNSIPRDQIGFYFSRIASGARPSRGIAASHGGTTTGRETVRRTGEQWANIDDLVIRSPGYKFTKGKAVRVSLRYEISSRPSVVFLYLDRDNNPYNGNTLMRLARYSTKIRGIIPVTLTGSTVGAPAGKYHLYAQITDNSGHIRYSYINHTVTLTKPVTTQAVSAPLSVHPLSLTTTALHSKDLDQLFV
jgi:hypothetical protein